MRHRLKRHKLGVGSGAHRVALLRNLCNALIKRERIRTTLVRAKVLRQYVEPLVTVAKHPSLANRRLVFSRVRDRDSVVKLFDDYGKRCISRQGGYLRVLRNGFRGGDNAPMAVIEFVDKHERSAAE